MMLQLLFVGMVICLWILFHKLILRHDTDFSIGEDDTKKFLVPESAFQSKLPCWCVLLPVACRVFVDFVLVLQGSPSGYASTIQLL